MIFEIIFGIMLIVVGMGIIINTEGIQILVLFYSGFLILIPTELISIIGIAIIIIGIVFLALVPLRLFKNIREYKKKVIQYEEKQEYKNPSWLTHQYYDLGESIQDIANEQNVSIVAIRKWIDKLNHVSED